MGGGVGAGQWGRCDEEVESGLAELQPALRRVNTVHFTEADAHLQKAKLFLISFPWSVGCSVIVNLNS